MSSMAFHIVCGNVLSLGTRIKVPATKPFRDDCVAMDSMVIGSTPFVPRFCNLDFANNERQFCLSPQMKLELYDVLA